jgi:hypothetical protein
MSSRPSACAGVGALASEAAGALVERAGAGATTLARRVSIAGDAAGAHAATAAIAIASFGKLMS